MRTRLALLASAIALAPAAARAQAPSIPGSPAPGYAPGYFTQIVGAYTFSGCATGPIGVTPGSGMVIGTPYCVSGLLTLGVRPVTGTPAGAVQYGSLDYAVAGDARLRNTPRAEFGDRQAVTGVFTGAACPVGCVWEFAFSNAMGVAGQQSFSELFTSDLTAVFGPREILVQLGYSGPNPGDTFFVSTTFALTAVPEPSTLALSVAGVLLAGGLARRRRA